ncbi:hypothetical protein BC826DRAFT_1039974 [Russula brevipes]|nr:hypothetical protein BC826DRAFT_1039974 [Russula brevipes]
MTLRPLLLSFSLPVPDSVLDPEVWNCGAPFPLAFSLFLPCSSAAVSPSLSTDTTDLAIRVAMNIVSLTHRVPILVSISSSVARTSGIAELSSGDWDRSRCSVRTKGLGGKSETNGFRCRANRCIDWIEKHVESRLASACYPLSCPVRDEEKRNSGHEQACVS